MTGPHQPNARAHGQQTGMTPDEFGYVIGDFVGAHLGVQATYKDSVEIRISNGSTFMGRRVYPLEMRELADWLYRWADRYEQPREPP